MPATMPLSALELREAVRDGRPVDTSRLNRILAIDAQRGLLEVQAATPWQSIAAEMRPGDPRANVRTTMPTVGESIARNAAGPDGSPAVSHVTSLTLVMPDGELRRVSRQREAELFALTVGGQGLFGTLYSVTLDIASLARAIEKQAEPQFIRLQPPLRAQQTLELFIPPEALDVFVRETDERCGDWRVPLQSVSVRHTLGEDETYLRWAQREYCELQLCIAPPGGLGGAVRTAQPAPRADRLGYCRRRQLSYRLDTRRHARAGRGLLSEAQVVSRREAPLRSPRPRGERVVPAPARAFA